MKYSARILCWMLPTVSSMMLTACGGSGQGLDQSGRPAGETGAASALTATFDSIQNNVFTPVCTKCHAGANAPRGLRLDAGNSYAMLVGVASSEVPNLQRVKAGDPDSSYLVQKISGTASVGARMPLDGPPYLPQETIDTIRQWITNGAPRPAAVAPQDGLLQVSMGGLKVITSAPADGDTVSNSLTQLIVGFDRELDANLVNPSTVTLERLDDHTPIAARLSVPIVNSSNVLVTVQEPLRNGSYRLTLRGTGGGALAGLDAIPLNSQGSFDGGQNVSIDFVVEVQQ